MCWDFSALTGINPVCCRPVALQHSFWSGLLPFPGVSVGRITPAHPELWSSGWQVRDLTRDCALTVAFVSATRNRWYGRPCIWLWQVNLSCTEAMVSGSLELPVPCQPNAGPPLTLSQYTQSPVCYELVQVNSLKRSSSKCYLRIQSVPQREHHTSPLQRSTG
jgi:hypothetical protein